jgi:hypothetical protein
MARTRTDVIRPFRLCEKVMFIPDSPRRDKNKKTRVSRVSFWPRTSPAAALQLLAMTAQHMHACITGAGTGGGLSGQFRGLTSAAPSCPCARSPCFQPTTLQAPSGILTACLQRPHLAAARAARLTRCHVMVAPRAGARFWPPRAERAGLRKHAPPAQPASAPARAGYLYPNVTLARAAPRLTRPSCAGG